ncbi:MAG: glycosyltransferase, partial [Armatimonadetes bacterium]|nr:glycosyltransferase [Armatimonadota bacterium]
MPRVGVVIAAYNSAATLARALESVAQQTFADWECVVVDDGSRDATAAIARAWAGRD